MLTCFEHFILFKVIDLVVPLYSYFNSYPFPPFLIRKLKKIQAFPPPSFHKEIKEKENKENKAYITQDG